MKRFALTAVSALAIGLATAATADAQYAYRQYNLTPGGVVVTNNYGNWGAFGADRTYVSPFGYRQQSYYGDVFGNTYGRSYGFNNFNGYGYNRGFGYNSFYPYGGYNYGFHRRW